MRETCRPHRSGRYRTTDWQGLGQRWYCETNSASWISLCPGIVETRVVAQEHRQPKQANVAAAMWLLNLLLQAALRACDRPACLCDVHRGCECLLMIDLCRRRLCRRRRLRRVERSMRMQLPELHARTEPSGHHEKQAQVVEGLPKATCRTVRHGCESRLGWERTQARANLRSLGGLLLGRWSRR
jgi:hypothetical protein